MLRALRGEDAIHAEARAYSFAEEVGPFDAGEALRIAAGLGESAAELFEAFVLLTLYNANRHLFELFASPRRFYADLRFVGRLSSRLNLHRRWCCDKFRFCGVCNCGVFGGLASASGRGCYANA